MALPQSICVVMSTREMRSNRVVLMLQSLAQQNINLDIHVCACPAMYTDDYQTTQSNLPHQLHMAGGIYGLPIIGLLLFLLWGIFSMTRNSIKKSEMVMISHYTFLPLAFWAKLLYRQTIWYDVREMLTYYVSPNYPQSLGSLIGAWERLFMGCVDLVTTVDSHRGLWIQRYRGMGKPAEVIYNVPSWEGIDHGLIARRIAEKDLAGTIEVVIVGAITEEQGIEQLMEIMSRWERPCHLHLYGVIHPNLQRRLKAIEEQGGTACPLIVHSWLPYAELVNTISTHHLGLMLKNPEDGQYGLLADGNSRKVFTYMQAGLPMLTPLYKSVALFVEREKVGFRVDISDPEQIARGLEEIVADPERYRAMASRGLDLVLNRYDWGSESRKLARFLADHGQA